MIEALADAGDRLGEIPGSTGNGDGVDDVVGDGIDHALAVAVACGVADTLLFRGPAVQREQFVVHA